MSGTFTAGDTKSGGYTYKSRFEGGPGSNPGQLIAATHAACLSMALALVLVQAGSPPDFVRTVTVTLRQVDGVPTITKIALVTAGAARRGSANRCRRDGDTSRLSTDSRSVRPAHH